MKKIVIILAGVFLSGVQALACNTLYQDCRYRLEDEKNKEVTLCHSLTLPRKTSMREYFQLVTKLDQDERKIKFMVPPRHYRDSVRTEADRLDTPVCFKAKFDGFSKDDPSVLDISGDGWGAGLYLDHVLMVYKKKSLLRRVLTLGLGPDKEVVYMHPDLFRLVREQPTHRTVN